MITLENFNEVWYQLIEERDRFMREGHVDEKTAGRLSVEKVADGMGLEVGEFKLALKGVIQQRRLKHVEDQRLRWQSLSAEPNQKLLARYELWHAHRAAFEAVLKVLFTHDPMGICDHSEGASEYAAEVNSILPRLKNAASAKDVLAIVFEEFVRWFGANENRNSSKYEVVASEIWGLLQDDQP